MQPGEIFFLFNAALLVILSLLVVLIRNPVRATFMLILSFLPTTVLYFFLHAPFVGILQILVYAGAILVLFTFVVMMVNPGPGDGDTPSQESVSQRPKHRSKLVAMLVAALLGGVLVPVFLTSVMPAQPDVRPDFGGLVSIGKMLFENADKNPFILSFELLSFLVLAGIVSAVTLARGKDPDAPTKQKNSFPN